MQGVLKRASERGTPSLNENTTLLDALLFSRLTNMDVLGVLSDSNLIGEVRFLDIINYLDSQHPSEKTLQEIFNVPIISVMNRTVNKISINDDIHKVFEKIKNSQSGNIFVMSQDDSLYGYITILDLIPWVLKNTNSLLTINNLGPKKNLIITNSNVNIHDVITLMLKHHIRRIIINGVNSKTIDDKILKKIFETNSTSKKTMNELFMEPIEYFAKNVTMINKFSTVHDIAKKIQNDEGDCFITNDYRMITPWNIVIGLYDNMSEKKDI